MVYDTTYHATEAEARKAAADFLRFWPAFGYGSNTQVYQDATGQWACYTSRYSSCD